MRENDWWRDVGPYHAWEACPSRPDPREVIQFYLQRRGIRSDEQVAYLTDRLNVQKSTIYALFKGKAFDPISRCRLLVQALHIPPPLLGLDAKYAPIEHHAYWWKKHGFSFKADAQGYPVLSEVVAYFRTQRGGNGRVKKWFQEDLGDATGLSPLTIYRMEHDLSQHAFESMRRRAIVATALGAGTGDMEPTIFRLFGLHPQAYRVPVPAQDAAVIVALPYRVLSDAVVREYQQKIAALFTEYSTSHAQDSVGRACEWVQHFSVLMPQANTTAQCVSLLALQSRTHRFLACIAREQCETERMLFHTAQALACAEHAMTLPRVDDHAGILTTSELLASALFTKALTSYELGQYDIAQASIDRALELFLMVQSRHLKAEVLGAAALIHSYTVTSLMDRQKVLSSMRRAAQMHTRSLSQGDPPDENFFRCDEGLLLLYKAATLSSPKMAGATSESVQDILGKAQRLTDPALIRQHVLIGYLQAKAHAASGSYKAAIEAALSALEKCRRIRSQLNRDRIGALHQRLLDTSFKDNPLLVYLGIKLRMWDYKEQNDVG